MITLEAPTSTAVNFSIRVNRQLKAESEMLFHSLGMNMTTAIQCFLRQAVIMGGLPFEVRLPLSKRENFEAWMEAKEIAADPNRRGVPVEQALEELAR
jgi:DNA-damage-inducible protein J